MTESGGVCYVKRYSPVCVCRKVSGTPDTVKRMLFIDGRTVTISMLSTNCAIYGHDLDPFADLGITSFVHVPVCLPKNVTSNLANMMPE